MPGTPFPVPKSSTPGSRPGEGEGRLFNCYSVTEGDRSYVRRTAGLAQLVATGKTGIRGLIDVNGVLYVVFTGSVVTVSGSTVTTLTGSIPGSDGVTLARNNKVTGGASTPDIVAVRESGGAYVLTSSAVSTYPDADLPATVNSVTFLGGFFIFSIADGRIFASELNSTDINALSFATAEARSDGLVRVIVRGNILYAMGGTTVEPWSNQGLSPFPLQRSPTVLQVGLLTTMAVAGMEDTWGGNGYFVSSDKRVMTLAGYETAPVSTPDVERFIAASTVSTIEVSAFIWKGRSFIAINSDQGSWVLDVAANSWHERGSTGSDRWRAKWSIYSGSQWVFGDRLSGDLLVMSDTLTENGSALGGFIQTGPLKDFPARVAAKLSADFTEAVITIYVSWSHDGGKTWSTELQRSITDAEKWPPSVSNLGLSTHNGIIAKFRWEGPQDFAFMGAVANRVVTGGV
ncbi:hypothetical protein IED13_01040 [Bosea sp. SSUT16]|uniref:Uncharacterized protein n=1 Tax=Bosea spartocytisi TaxID=2773451 RepID=A0A927E8L8_9HYPH|nr:hypothetical protein [Bosea spartocytisi]MBD3844264.1 hypothetical protein [Bosea spartocytisi]MCT4470630.1 hypothetical protein [Bosea spartocytisi]